MSIRDELVPTEEDECIAFYDWVQLQPDIRRDVFHIKNGGSLKKKQVSSKGQIKLISLEGKRLKRMGVKKGVFDYFMQIPNRYYHGLYIEVKRTKFYVISQEQKDFQVQAIARGFAALFCFGADHAIRAVKEYLQDYPDIKG